MREKLSVRGRNLKVQAGRARRFLPKSVRSDAVFLSESVKLAENPKLLRMLDQARLDAAYQNCTRFLNGIDPSERRKAMLLSIITRLAFVVVVVFALVVTLLAWRGFL